MAHVQVLQCNVSAVLHAQSITIGILSKKADLNIAYPFDRHISKVLHDRLVGFGKRSLIYVIITGHQQEMLVRRHMVKKLGGIMNGYGFTVFADNGSIIK